MKIPIKDYSKADEMLLSEDWNTFYTGMLMKSKLSLEDCIVEELRFFSKNLTPELSIIVSREAQIQMYMWYSILTDKSFLKKFYVDDHESLVFEKAKTNWRSLIKITNELKSTKNLIVLRDLNPQELNEYGKTKQGNKAWKIKQDNSNRFVYVPKKSRFEHRIDIIDCMFHYRDERKRLISESQSKDISIQYALWSIYVQLTKKLPKDITSNKFRSIIKRNYLLDLFRTPNLIKL